MGEHNPRARYCIAITDPPLPAWMLSDDECCPACDDLRALLELDPDVEVLSKNPCPVHGGRDTEAVERCSTCGAPWQPVRRGECLHCGSDAGPERRDTEAGDGR